MCAQKIQDAYNTRRPAEQLFSMITGDAIKDGVLLFLCNILLCSGRTEYEDEFYPAFRFSGDAVVLSAWRQSALPIMSALQSRGVQRPSSAKAGYPPFRAASKLFSSLLRGFSPLPEEEAVIEFLVKELHCRTWEAAICDEESAKARAKLEQHLHDEEVHQGA